jgi:hypothetical protein
LSGCDAYRRKQTTKKYTMEEKECIHIRRPITKTKNYLRDRQTKSIRNLCIAHLYDDAAHTKLIRFLDDNMDILELYIEDTVTNNEVVVLLLLFVLKNTCLHTMNITIALADITEHRTKTKNHYLIDNLIKLEYNIHVLTGSFFNGTIFAGCSYTIHRFFKPIVRCYVLCSFNDVDIKDHVDQLKNPCSGPRIHECDSLYLCNSDLRTTSGKGGLPDFLLELVGLKSLTLISCKFDPFFCELQPIQIDEAPCRKK